MSDRNPPAGDSADGVAPAPPPHRDAFPTEGAELDSTGDGPIPPYVRRNDAAPDSARARHAGDRQEPGFGSVIGRRYRVVRRLGEGGMGVVYLAEQTEPVARQVALKVIKPGMDSVRVLARFEAERQALALMDHPYIARVLDAGATDAARPFFVMEVVDGPPLTAYCDGRRLTVRERLALFVGVCRAVQHAHQKGVIHRDLKPSNILVTEVDGKPVPKIIDFGLAKALGGDPLTDWSLVTSPGALVGTPLYMAPEQAGGNPADIDTRADVYSLGVILYELLTGTTPIDREELGGAAPDELLRAIRETDAGRPSGRLAAAGNLSAVAAARRTEPARLARLVRGELDWITLKALEKDRTRRYEGPGAFADDVARYLDNEPVSAAPPSRWYGGRKFVRRNRGAVIAASLVCATLVAGVAGTTVGLVREASQRREAERRKRDAEFQRDRAVTAEAEVGRRLEEVIREKNRADEEAETAREVSAFLREDILLLADPRNQADRGAAANPDLTLRASLDRAAARIGDRFRGKPLVEAAIRRAIGEAQVGLGLPEIAVPHLERAAELLKTARGPTHEDTLEAANSLGVAYRAAGDVERAERVFGEVVRVSTEAFGPDHHNTLIGRSNLADTFLISGRAGAAVKLYEEVVGAAKAKLGADHQDALVFASNLARALYQADRTAEATVTWEDCVVRGRRKWPGGHPDLVPILLSLGNSHLATGDTTRALPLLQEAAGVAKRVYALDHPTVGECCLSLGTTRLAVGDSAGAAAALEEALAAMRARYGERHRDTLATTNTLAVALRQAGNPARAAELLTPALTASTEAHGRDDPLTITLLGNLAEMTRAKGDPAAAVPLFEEAARRASAVMGKKNPNTLQVVHNLAVTYRAAGKPDDARRTFLGRLAAARTAHTAESLPLAGELSRAGADLMTVAGHADAEPVLRESVALYQKLEPDGWSLAHARSLLGESLLGQRRYADAEPLLAAGYQGLLDRREMIPPNRRGVLASAADRLCELYTAWGKPDEARRWRAERAEYGTEVAPAPRSIR